MIVVPLRILNSVVLDSGYPPRTPSASRPQ
jgi:hypothetical protein